MSQGSLPRADLDRRARFLEDVLAGLQTTPKSLPCKYFYDQRGADLFVEICHLEEYYLTRTEMALLEDKAAEIATCLGPSSLVIELGSGEARKTEILLAALENPAGYVPVDLSIEQLAETTDRIERRFPGLPVQPVAADYSSAWDLPKLPTCKRRAVFFPGSTVGNFTTGETITFFRQLRPILGSGGALLIGADLEKDVEILERAYNDTRGITAAFNLNLLARINRELAANFQLETFAHRAVYNRWAGRIEMYLESLKTQTIRISDRKIELEAGERICTEYSHKYTLEGFCDMAAQAGLTVTRVWTDERRWFSVQLLEPRQSEDGVQPAMESSGLETVRR